MCKINENIFSRCMYVDIRFKVFCFIFFKVVYSTLVIYFLTSKRKLGEIKSVFILCSKGRSGKNCLVVLPLLFECLKSLMPDGADFM